MDIVLLDPRWNKYEDEDTGRVGAEKSNDSAVSVCHVQLIIADAFLVLGHCSLW